MSLKLTKYLKRIVRNERLVDIPCYIDQDTIEKVLDWEKQLHRRDQDSNLIFAVHRTSRFVDSVKGWFIITEENSITLPIIKRVMHPPSCTNCQALEVLCVGAVQLNFILRKNCNSLEAENLINLCAKDGNEEIIKVVLPFAGNLNVLHNNMSFLNRWTGSQTTPITKAIMKGHLNIVKLLAPLVDDPNFIPNSSLTNIYMAADLGHIEIIKILAPLTQNPNARIPLKMKGFSSSERSLIPKTPDEIAERNGHNEAARLLRFYDNVD